MSRLLVSSVNRWSPLLRSANLRCSWLGIREKGHSKWQNIQHIKGAEDQRQSKINVLHSNKIFNAVRVRKNPRFNRKALKSKWVKTELRHLPDAQSSRYIFVILPFPEMKDFSSLNNLYYRVSHCSMYHTV